MREAVSTIEHSGQHMHALTDGLLDVARIEAGRLRLDLTTLSFPDFLSQLTRMVQPQAESKGLRFTLRTQGRVPAWVKADAKRLRQILINLLANAVRYTDKGEIVFRVDCRHDVIRFEVQDTGIGIAPQDQERIFLPFERGLGGRRSSESGTGLGLTITHLLTQLMGGELTLRSAPGQGSTFTVRLHLSETFPDPELARASTRCLQSVSGYLGARRTLLVVDDQVIQRQLMASLLVPLGFEVKEAASGWECLQVVPQLAPDIILMDINMGELDGWQTAQALRASGATIPIIIVSANLFDNRVELLEQMQCQGFVGKPVVESELLEALSRVLQIEWVHENQFSALPLVRGACPAPEPQALHLPGELRQDLLRMARFGHASGLRQLLRSAPQTYPVCAADLQLLQPLVERFDFDSIIACVKEVDDEA